MRIFGRQKLKLSKRQLSEAGLVSFIVALIMTLVMSLIVLGFAEVARRNVRETLDRQLATQAFYAAETGINDTINYIKANPGYNPGDGRTCNNFRSLNTTPPLPSNVLNAAAGVSYTCLLVNPSPGTLTVDVSLGDSKVKYVNPTQHQDSGGGLQFTWHRIDNTGGNTNATGCPATLGSFVQADSWAPCNFAVLRVDLFDVTAAGGSPTASTMAANTYSMYLFPMASGASVTLKPGQGNIVAAGCPGNEGAGSCTATVVLPNTNQIFYARISSIYGDAGLVGISSSVPNTLFNNSEIQIDATGKANDVLKRIKVSVPITQFGNAPANALSVGDQICKRFTIIGVSGSRANGAPDDSTIANSICP